MCLMLGTCVLSEVHTYRNVTDATEGDYKVKMLDQQIEAAEADLKEKKWLREQAVANAEEADGHKNLESEGGEAAAYESPLDNVDAGPIVTNNDGDGDDDDDEVD